MKLVPVSREQLKKINSRRADMTDEERVELDALNRSASAFSNHRELYEHVRKTGYQRGADPESLVRSFVGLTGWESEGDVSFAKEESKFQRALAFSSMSMTPPGVAPPPPPQIEFRPSEWEKLTKEFFGQTMTPEQAEEVVLGQLENLYSPGKNPVLEFAGWDQASQEEEAVGNENKRRRTVRQTRKPDGTNEPVLNMPGVDYTPFTKDQLDVDQDDPKQVQTAVSGELQRRMEQSPGMIFQAAAEYLTPEQEIMAGAVALAEEPSHVWELYREKIEEMDLEQWGAFRSAVLALKPEFDRNFLERQAGVFGMAERRVRNAGRMLSNLGLDLVTFADNEREISREIDRQIPTAFDESGRLLPEHEKAVRQIIRDATKIERLGMSEEVEDYYFENLPEMVARAKKRDRQDMLEYGVRQMTGFTQYKDLGKFQEGVLAVEGITADMLGVLAVSSVPVVGKAAVLTMTYGSFQSEIEERLRFEHDVAPETARLISGIYAVPYALSEYYQVKHLNPATWGKGTNEGAMKLMTGMSKPGNAAMFSHYFKEYFARATWRELKEEYIQAGIQFGAMETARNFAQSEGIEFDQNLQELVQESIEATIYMPFVTMLGGGAIGGFNAARTGDLSAMVAPEFKQAWHDQFIPAKAWGDSQDARKQFNEMQQAGGLSIDRYPRALKRLVRRADAAADQMKFRGGARDADGVLRDADGNIAQNQGGGRYILTDQNTKIEDWEALDREVKQAIRDAGYEDVGAALAGIRTEIEADNVRVSLAQEDVAIYRDRLAGELGQADETDVLSSPKLSLIESALDAYGARLGVNLKVYTTQQEALDAYPELKAAKGNKLKASLMPDGRTVVVVEENLDNAADGAEQFYHEVFGHRGLDLNPKAQRLYDELNAAVDPDFIRSELPEFYRNMTDEAVLEEYLARLTAKAARGQEFSSATDRSVWDKFRSWAGKELGLTPDAAMRAQDVARLARDVLSFAKNHNALYPDGTDVKLNRKTYRRDGGRWVNEKGQAITDAGMVSEIEAAADAEIQKAKARDQKAATQRAQQRIQQMIDADPVLARVEQEGGIRMPDLKPGESYPDEFAAVPQRFRGKKGSGLAIDEMATTIGAMTQTEADYSTSDLTAYLEAFDAKAERILAAAQESGVGSQGSANEESRLIADLESGKITQGEFEGAMAELTGARFSVENIDYNRLKELGTTKDLNEAGYIMPNGRLVDLSGKKEGGSAGNRSYDHREAGGTPGMQEFMAQGNIRMDYTTGTIDLVTAPTPAQEKIIRQIVEDKDGYVVVDLDRGLGQMTRDGSYYINTPDHTSIEFAEGTSSTKVLGTIRRYFKGEAFESGLRFSVEQQGDPVQETAAHVAGRIFQGDFQFKRVTRGKRKGELVERPEKDQIAEVENLLKSQGQSPKLAAQVLADAKEIATRVSKDRESLTNSRLLSKAIREESLRQQFRSLVKHAYSKGQQGGEYFKAAQAHVEERIRQQAAAMQTQPGLLIEDLENEYGVKVKDLLDRLELEEKREKPRKTDDRRQTTEEEEASEGGKEMPPDLSPQEQEIYREPAEQYLHKIKSAVIRDLLKNKTIDDAGTFSKNLRNPIVRAAYAETLKHVLLKTSAELNYGFERDVIERGIRRIADAALLSTIDRRAERLIQQMFDNRVKETKEELFTRAQTALDGFKGRIKSRQQDVSRKVTARIEQLLRHARKALLLPVEASEKKLLALNDQVNSLANRAFEGDPDAQAEFEAALDELNAYMRFAGFKFKTVAEMAEQLDWLENTMADEMAKQEERREALRKETQGILNKLLPTLPNRKQGRAGQAYFSQFLEHKLEAIARFGKEGDRQSAQKELQKLTFDLARGNFRKHQGVAEDNRAFGEALATIYGVNAGRVLRPAQIQRVLHELSRPREEYAPYSIDGIRLSKAHLLQLLGSLAQESIRSAAFVQLELRARVEGKEGTVEEIARSLWQDEQSAIKYTTAKGVQLTAGHLEHFVRTIEEGSRLSKRLEMEKAMRDELTAEDMKLLDWFRDYYRRNRPALSEVNKEVTGLQIVPPDVYYIPIKRDIETGLKGVNISMPVVPPSLSIRTFNARDLDETASIVDLYMQRLESNQSYIHFARLHQRTARLFNNPELLKALRNTHGKKFVDELLEHLRDVLSAQPLTGRGGDVAKHLTNYFAATRLGFNVGLMPRQITSLPAFAMYVPTAEFLKYSASAFTADGLAAMKTILASPHAKTRLRLGNTQLLNQMLSEMDPKGKAVGIAEVYQRLGTLPTKVGDIVPTLIFGSGYYRAMLSDASRQGMRSDEAHEWAMDQLWRLVEMSQQSGLMINLARWQRSGGPGFKLLGQFISTPQQFASKEFHDIMDLAAAIETEGWGSERARKAGIQVVKSVGIGGFLLAALYGGTKMLWDALLLGDEPDEEDWHRLMLSVLSGPFAGIVIFGTVIEAVIEGGLTGSSGYGHTLVPAAGIVSDAQALGALIYNLIEDPDAALEDLDRLLRANQALYRDISKAVENYGE
jgi:hypothetical protein